MKQNCIRRIYLKNFKNFTVLDADFKAMFKNDSPFLNFVYGPNAVGKSNLASSLRFLYDSAYTLFINPYLIKMDFSKYDDISSEINETAEGKSITKLVRKYKRKSDEKNQMKVLYEFDYKGIFYEYALKFGYDNVIEEEYLKIKEGQRLTDVFIIKVGEKPYLSKTHFLSEKFLYAMEYSLTKHGGEHTLIAILKDEMRVNSSDFTNKTMSSALLAFFDLIENIDMRNQMSLDSGIDNYDDHYDLLENLEYGKIFATKENDEKIKFTESFINHFFKIFMPDVDNVYYHLETIDNKIKYQIMFDRKDYLKHVNPFYFEEESTGTKNLIYLISFFYQVLQGKTIILDDINLGLDENLVKEIMWEFKNTCDEVYSKFPEHIFGELFIITHNTTFMSDVNKRFNVFTLSQTGDLIKPYELKPYIGLSREIQKSTNLRKRYQEKNNIKINKEVVDLLLKYIDDIVYQNLKIKK